MVNPSPTKNDAAPRSAVGASADGGAAFPGKQILVLSTSTEAWEEEVLTPGMSLRDYFAAKAMHAMLNNEVRHGEMATIAGVAKDAYRMADAMLEEKENG